MRRIIFAFSFFGIILTGCSGDDSTDTNPTPPDNNDAFEITISSLPDVLEVTTVINISVDNTNTVNSTVFIDNTEIMSSQQSEFSVEIDPFDYLNGNRVLRVEARDDDGNESVETVNFELRKLLFVLTDLQGSFDDFDVYIALNTPEGVLITSEQVTENSEHRFFAPDGFERENFIVTRYLLGKDGTSGNATSFVNVRPLTETLSLAEIEARRSPSGLPRDNSFDIDFTSVTESNRFFSISGQKYSSQLTDFANNIRSETINYNSSLDNPIFISTSTVVDNLANDLSNYRYTFISDLNDQTLDVNDLTLLNNASSVSIPDANTFSLDVRAYFNQEDYELFDYQRIMDLRASSGGLNPSDFNNTINIPVIQEFEIVQQVMTLTTDNSSFLIFRRGLDPISIPDWSVTFSNDEININAQNSDISTIRERVQRDTGTFGWTSFVDNETDQISRISLLVEVPTVVENFFTSNLINVNVLNSLDVDVFDYEQPITYENFIFNGLLTQNERGDIDVGFFRLVN